MRRDIGLPLRPSTPPKQWQERLLIFSQEMAHLETKQTTLENLALALNLSEILLIVENQVVLLLSNDVY